MRKFPIMVDDASCHLSCYSSTHASIWHRYRDMALKGNEVMTLIFWVHVTSSVMRVVHSVHASIWHRYGDMAVWSSSRKVLSGTEVGRWSVSRQYYTDLTYSSSLC